MSKYEDFKNSIQKIADVGFASAVLGWDQETYMPPKGAEFRSRQLATLAGIAHGMFTEPTLEKQIRELAADKTLGVKEAKNVELTLEELDKQKKYSSDFVEEMSRSVSACFSGWNEAREKNDFKVFSSSLEKLIDLKKKECELLGYTEHPYNALLDQYEKKLTVKDVDVLFNQVRAELVPFVKKIFAAKQVNDDFFYQQYDKQKQWDFGIEILKQMGYDFEAGRQDVSAHPFTTNFNARDVRVTTRTSENNLSEMLWSCIHEGGHALYEQGLPAEEYGLPLSEAVSLGIHESQSRLWENNVGRSLAYWKNNFPRIQQIFPEQLKSVSAEQFYFAMNKVEPSLIRTNADELTYHFHIMIRYEIEKLLLEEKIKVAELPEIWNAKYKEYLNIDVPDARQGVLQDVHWSHGSLGYFPTYSIGSFYAAQFFAQAEKQINGLKNQIEKGELKNLLNFLREKVHKHGKMYSAQALCEQISGEKLNFTYFMNYAKEKYGKIYNL
ncbi:MAG: carboxypeptidase M32 [Bacteroidia bacterium]|nr:carboxypeptidase M32 [Bacteroidia bacterium]